MNENALGLIAVFLLIVMAVLSAAGVTLFLRVRSTSWGFVKPYLSRKHISVRLWCILAAAAYAAVFIAGFHQASNGYAKAMLSLNYAEASKGQNANGTRYNMSEVICDEVVARAIKRGALENVAVQDLKNCLEISPAVQGDAGSEETYHISTEFFLIYKASGKTSHLDAQNVVQLGAEAYKDFYIENYAENYRLLNMDIDPETQFQDLDYLDIQTNLANQAAAIETYMYCLANKNPSFVSSSGETFYSVAQKARQLSGTQIENNLYSLILYNGLSKNMQEYLDRLGYENTMMGYDNQKASASFRVRNEAISMYSEEMTRIVLVPTTDAAGEFYMSRTKVGIDELAREAQSYSTQAAEYLKQIETNTSVIGALQSGTGASGEEADAIIRQISQGLEELSAGAKKVAQEYSSARMNQCVTATILTESFAQKALSCFLLTVLFFISLVLLSMARGIPKKLRSELLEEEEALREKQSAFHTPYSDHDIEVTR